MSEEWDVVIVGAGPAGSSAALAVLQEQPNARVLLLDRATFPRDKSCGDGLAPQVIDVLDSLGVGAIVDGWTPLRELELSRGSRTVRGLMARPVYVIPREVFDTRLVERAVSAGAHLAHHRVRDARVDGASVVIDEQFRTRALISADGAHSVIRASLAPTQGRRAIAARQPVARTPPARCPGTAGTPSNPTATSCMPAMRPGW
ncbi:NAD(P)/FAD-dependent oxidoreductase [Flexivirga alba]|uniref:NAD(P)/FAD-dependent oxidoreductase n=1 Tax=Flexivirga alba TaxID=702742 RepID=A0ABW2AL34_9MICO